MSFETKLLFIEINSFFVGDGWIGIRTIVIIGQFIRVLVIQDGRRCIVRLGKLCKLVNFSLIIF